MLLKKGIKHNLYKIHKNPHIILHKHLAPVFIKQTTDKHKYLKKYYNKFTNNDKLIPLNKNFEFKNFNQTNLYSLVKNYNINKKVDKLIIDEIKEIFSKINTSLYNNFNYMIKENLIDIQQINFIAKLMKSVKNLSKLNKYVDVLNNYFLRIILFGKNKYTKFINFLKSFTKEEILLFFINIYLITKLSDITVKYLKSNRELELLQKQLNRNPNDINIIIQYIDFINKYIDEINMDDKKKIEIKKIIDVLNSQMKKEKEYYLFLEEEIRTLKNTKSNVYKELKYILSKNKDDININNNNKLSPLEINNEILFLESMNLFFPNDDYATRLRYLKTTEMLKNYNYIKDFK
jgi:hypothetical protein